MNNKTKILICCKHCANVVIKDKKEITRRLKQNKNDFFCNNSCSSKYNNKIKPRKGNPDNLKIYGKINKTDEFSPFRYYIQKAKDRKFETDLTLDYLKNLWELQNGKCAFLNIDLIPNTKQSNQDPRFLASLDRIDSSKGYLQKNVQFVSACLNYAKSSLSNDHFLEFLEIIRNSK